MQSLRGSLIYTAFATVAFLALQYYTDDEITWQVLAYSGVLFFFFTFAMLRLVQRVMGVVSKGMGPGRQRDEAERGPTQIEATTDRPEHARRRRERARRRR